MSRKASHDVLCRFLLTTALAGVAACAGSAGPGLTKGDYEEARAVAQQTSRSHLEDTRLTTRPLNQLFENPNLSSSEMVEIVKLLLARGARVDAMDRAGDTALICAARAGQVEAVRVLLDAGADIDRVNLAGESAFSVALGRNDAALAQLLSERGVQRDTRNNENETPVYLAALDGDAEEVDRLLGLGEPLERRGKTALMGACAGGHLELARYLVDERGARTTTVTGFGETAATFAAESGRLELVEYLIAKGDACESGRRTPLMAAAAGGHLDIVNCLLELGVDPDAAVPGQVPAIIHAAVREHDAVTCRLLDAGRGRPIDVDVEDATLRATGNETIANCLIAAGRSHEAVPYLEDGASAHVEASLEYKALAEEYEGKASGQAFLGVLAFVGSIALPALQVEQARIQARQSAQLFALQYASENRLTLAQYHAIYDPARAMDRMSGGSMTYGAPMGSSDTRGLYGKAKELHYRAIAKEARNVEASLLERASSLRARAVELRAR